MTRFQSISPLRPRFTRATTSVRENPDYTTFTDAQGKPKPWHHTMRKAKDGTLTPWVPMGVCAVEDGTVYIETISPFTLLRVTPETLKKHEK